jgi:hypothetical protein
MNNKSILLINPDFDPSTTEKLSLTVKIGTDTFSYAIADDEHQLLYAVYDEQECEDGNQKFLERIKVDSYLTLNYKSVKVATTTSNFACIPNQMATDDFAKLQTAFWGNEEGTTLYKQEQNDDFTTVFSLPKSTEQAIDNAWIQNKKLYEKAGLLQIISTKSKDAILIDFTVKSFHIIYQKDQKVIFQQSYQFDDAEEVTYYLLLTSKQLSIETKNTQAKLSGIIHQGDEKWNSIAEYFDDVEFLPVVSRLDISILDDMPAHYYTNLLALHECE